MDVLSPDSETLTDLLARIARADEGALRRLYDAAGPRLYAVALRVLGDAKEAGEAVEQHVTEWGERCASALAALAEEMAPPCGEMGPQFSGDRSFFAVEGDPTTVVFVEYGSEIQIFDASTIRPAG